jgi:predicted RNase H-like HicB family nuclease
MANGSTAVIEQDGEWFTAYCPEVPGANGRGRTKEEALASLTEAISLALGDRGEERLRGCPTGGHP